jgi:hypothetical protein
MIIKNMMINIKYYNDYKIQKGYDDHKYYKK